MERGKQRGGRCTSQETECEGAGKERGKKGGNLCQAKLEQQEVWVFKYGVY